MGPKSELLNPPAGTVALKQTAFSEDGRSMAYCKSSGGSDWCTIHLMRIDAEGRCEELPDVLDLVKFSSLAWTHDHK